MASIPSLAQDGWRTDDDDAPCAVRARAREKETAESHAVSAPQSSVMSRLLAAAAVLAGAGAASAQTYSNLPLRFRADGTFKVLTFSDTHFTRNTGCKCVLSARA